MSVNSAKINIATIVKDYNYTSDIENGVVNYLIIILPDTEICQNISNSIFENDSQRFSYLRENGESIFIYYNEKGEWGIDPKGVKISISKLKNEIKNNGIYNIFEEGNGILASGPGHHYILQNNFHSDKFIRTANILTRSTYIDFLAVFLLEFISEDIEQIYIDTSGIISIAYSIIKLKQLFSVTINPLISSFDSYNGIHNLMVTQFTKILISASTSGKLSKRLIDIGFSKENINILFYLNEKPTEAMILCNLSDFKILGKSDKYLHFNIENESNCIFCKSSSYPIKIVGEQFLPEELKVDTFTFDLRDGHLWLTNFIRNYFHKQNIIKCFYKKYPMNVTRDIFLDFKEILKEYKQNSKLERYLSSKLPNKVDVLIHYEDDGSIYLKDLILKKYRRHISVIADTDLIQNKSVVQKKNILIVSSTITNGRRLVETSLKLRECNCKGICYFVGVSRSPDKVTLETTRKYIGFDNKFGREINPLNIVDSIFISDTTKNSTFSELDKSSWETEKEFLKVVNKGNKNLEFRVKDLGNNQGLVDNLFWGNSENEPLKLRSNFVFFTGIENIKAETTSQAQVFFLINSILHNLRVNPEKKIIQSAYHRHVISPETFVCYNDGIIQASILRSANTIELNYALLGNNTKIGTEMINVLRYIFNNFDNQIGESTTEFLISICTKRMKLINKELLGLINPLIKKVTESKVKNKKSILFLGNYIKNKIYENK